MVTKIFQRSVTSKLHHKQNKKTCDITKIYFNNSTRTLKGGYHNLVCSFIGPVGQCQPFSHYILCPMDIIYSEKMVEISHSDQKNQNLQIFIFETSKSLPWGGLVGGV